MLPEEVTAAIAHGGREADTAIRSERSSSCLSLGREVAPTGD